MLEQATPRGCSTPSVEVFKTPLDRPCGFCDSTQVELRNLKIIHLDKDPLLLLLEMFSIDPFQAAIPRPLSPKYTGAAAFTTVPFC